MKKIVLLLLCYLALYSSVSAKDTVPVPYKNIKEGDVIAVSDTNFWSIKKSAEENSHLYTRNGNDFYIDNNLAFSTDCDFLFTEEGVLIGYSPKDLKFYEFIFQDNQIIKRELVPEEVKTLFPKFNIIKISGFSATNAQNVNKEKHICNIMLINDTTNEYGDYSFTTNSAKFRKYNINNAIKVSKKGMIQFSAPSESSTSKQWFIILVR